MIDFLTSVQTYLLVNIFQIFFFRAITGPRNLFKRFPLKHVQLLSISLC
jgi:hypothetical protein